MKNESEKTNIAVIAKDIEYIKRDIAKINQNLDGEYITRQEFEPIKKIVYGVVSLILTAAIGGIVALLSK